MSKYCQECGARKYWLDQLDPMIILEGKGDPLCPEHAAARDARAIGQGLRKQIADAVSPPTLKG